MSRDQSSSVENGWVQQALDEALRSGWISTSTLGEDHARLLESLLVATAGGKRFLPRLVAVVHDLLGGRALEALAHVAAAVELLHTAFVVHDDVIDGDQTRRGIPTAQGRFQTQGLAAGASEADARTYGLAGAVLTGDLALSAAFRAIATASLPAPARSRLLDLLDRAMVISAIGELTDVRLALGLDRTSLGESLRMEEHKTAVYSFELPMQAGAILAEATPEMVTGLGEVGRLVGIAFQLRDDLLGVFGDPDATGKSSLADLRDGKGTPLIVHARSTTAWPLIEPYWGDRELDDEDAIDVRRALEDCGSRSFVERLADRYLADAASKAASLGLPQDFVASLEELCDPVSGERP